MTREQKLALIIGFSLVLLVGVLVSDHLSGARNAHLADVGAALEQSSPPDFVDPLPESLTNQAPVEQTAATNEPAPTNTSHERAASPPPPAANETRLADENASPSEMFLRNLRQQFRETTDNAVPALQHETYDATQTDPPVADPLVPQRREYAVQTYRIKTGDSLWSIAQRHYGDSAVAKKLADYNVQRGRLRDPDTIRVGASILLPEPSAFGISAPQRAARTQTRDHAPATPRTYTVRKGDTLGAIAQKQLGSVRHTDDILSANASLIDDPDDIRVGMVLTLPAS